VDLEEEDATGVGAVWRAHYCGLPVEHVFIGGAG
jgi:hypothetical protein